MGTVVIAAQLGNESISVLGSNLRNAQAPTLVRIIAVQAISSISFFKRSLFCFLIESWECLGIAKVNDFVHIYIYILLLIMFQILGLRLVFNPKQPKSKLN